MIQASSKEHYSSEAGGLIQVRPHLLGHVVEHQVAVPGPAPELAAVGHGLGDTFLELHLELPHLVRELPHMHATAAERDEVLQDLRGQGDPVIRVAHAEPGHGPEDEKLVVQAPLLLLFLLLGLDLLDGGGLAGG